MEGKPWYHPYEINPRLIELLKHQDIGLHINCKSLWHFLKLVRKNRTRLILKLDWRIQGPEQHTKKGYFIMNRLTLDKVHLINSVTAAKPANHILSRKLPLRYLTSLWLLWSIHLQLPMTKNLIKHLIWNFESLDKAMKWYFEEHKQMRPWGNFLCDLTN